MIKEPLGLSALLAWDDQPIHTNDKNYNDKDIVQKIKE